MLKSRIALVWLVGSLLRRHPAAPQDIVRDKQAALANARGYQPEDTRIIFFVDVVEDDVELLLLLREQFQRVTGEDFYFFADPGPLEVLARLLGILWIAIGVENLAVGRQAPPTRSLSSRSQNPSRRRFSR